MERNEAKVIHEKFSAMARKFCLDNGIVHTGSGCTYSGSGEFAIRTRMVLLPTTAKPIAPVNQSTVDFGLAPMGLSVWIFYNGDAEAKAGYYAATIIGTKPRRSCYIYKWVSDDDEDRQYITAYTNVKIEHPKTGKRTGL